MPKAADKSNAERFIIAYNEIDYSLRTIYGFKRNLTFSDLIRKAVTLNSVVRKYEEDLIDYARLRNSIVHRANPNYIIAEPHEEVVVSIEKIAKLIATPPKALDLVGKKEVVCEDSKTNIKKVIQTLGETGYFNLPIYDGNRLLGVANGRDLVKAMGIQIDLGANIEDYISKTPVKDTLTDFSDGKYFKVADKDLSVEKALNLFYVERKLGVILITENGSYNEKPISIITTADILDMNATLENY